MRTQNKIILMAMATIAIFASCKKDSDTNNNQPQPSSSGSINFKFNAMVVNDTFAFNQNYISAAGDTFSVNMLKYYVSNLVLTKTDDSQINLPNSYFLVDHNTFMEDEFTIGGIPEGSYKKISFLLGVDSAANVSGAQAGDLDPAKGMFWDWNSGYIMSRLEGYSSASTAIGKKIIFHVGGFTKPNLSLRNITIDFNGSTANVSQWSKPKITIKTDVSEWFKTPNTIDFSTLNTVMMPGASSNSIADNYQDAFSLQSIQN
ncbi:MAG: MbnP family protein [Bacteroidota bacterium]|jgi:hypothetical protein